MLFRWRSGLWSLRKLCASSACFSRSRSRRSHSVPHHPGSIRYCWITGPNPRSRQLSGEPQRLHPGITSRRSPRRTMKEEGFFMKTRSTLRSAVLRSTTAIAITAGTMLLSAGLLAQAPTATIHGHVQNPAGQAVNNGEVRLATDRSSPEKDRKYKYTFPVDANGNYKGDGVAPDDYVLFYYQNGKSVDFLEHVVLKAGEDKTADDDMTREDFLKNLTPEERKNIEEFKKKNSATVNANKQVANLNTMLASARADQKAG